MCVSVSVDQVGSEDGGLSRVFRFSCMLPNVACSLVKVVSCRMKVGYTRVGGRIPAREGRISSGEGRDRTF